MYAEHPCALMGRMRREDQVTRLAKTRVSLEINRCLNSSSRKSHGRELALVPRAKPLTDSDSGSEVASESGLAPRAAVRLG